MPAKHSIHFGLAIGAWAVLAAGTVAAQQVVVSQNGAIELAISNDQYTCPRANQPDMPVHVIPSLE